MLLSIERILSAPIMSLQTGQPLAKLVEPIIDPRKLRIVAFYVSGPLVGFSPAIVFSDDIREFGPLGAIVDSSDNILSPEGMIRLEEVIDYAFHLRGIRVIDDRGTKVGKVDGYIVDPLKFDIMQINVRPPFPKNFSITDLSISRNQIVAIDNSKITVKAPTIKIKQPDFNANQMLNPSIDNPFRKSKPMVNGSNRAD